MLELVKKFNNTGLVSEISDILTVPQADEPVRVRNNGVHTFSFSHLMKNTKGFPFKYASFV